MRAERILIVEDEGILVGHLESMVCALGYTVLTPVATGEAALAAVAAELPDMVLMDICLAGDINGITAAKEIWRDWGIPVVFLTAHADDSMLQEAKDAAPYGYLIKPVSERALAATLTMAFHRHSLDRQLKEASTDLSTSPVKRLPPEILSQLSRRDREVLDLLVKGMALKQIATALGISIQAVSKHRQRIFRKLGVESIVELLNRSKDL